MPFWRRKKTKAKKRNDELAETFSLGAYSDDAVSEYDPSGVQLKAAIARGDIEDSPDDHAKMMKIAKKEAKKLGLNKRTWYGRRKVRTIKGIRPEEALFLDNRMQVSGETAPLMAEDYEAAAGSSEWDDSYSGDVDQ